MAVTNFSRLTDEQILIWSKDVWRQARNMSFIAKFLGKSHNSVVQRITELTKTTRGTRAIITMVNDLSGDGVAGDRELEGNEEGMTSSSQIIEVDQLRHAVRSKGKLEDQKTVINFREEARDKLAYWLADRTDQLAFLTLAGIDYSHRNSGGTRPTAGETPLTTGFYDLEFRKQVQPPSSNRAFRWARDAVGSGGALVGGSGSNQVVARDTPTWDLFVQLKAQAQDLYIPPVVESGNSQVYHAFLSPAAMAKLKLDENYMKNQRNAGTRGDKNRLFSGEVPLIDGIYFHEFRHVPNTRTAPVGEKYGADGSVDGAQILFCGAQALGYADIGPAPWVEDKFNYDNAVGIAHGRIFGLLKPQFISQRDDGVPQDNGVISVYVAQ